MENITLATLPQATPQQVFDHVARHLLTQASPSIEGSVCAYLTSDGKRCAAGCLIGQDEYQASFEGRTWWGLVRDGRVPAAHVYLIEDLQNAHDLSAVSYDSEQVPFLVAAISRLHRVGLLHGLSFVVISESGVGRKNMRKCGVRAPEGTMEPQAMPE